MKNFVLLLCAAFLWTAYGNKFSSRIVGGYPVVAGELPFAAAIYVHKTDGTYFCGGTLITNEYILTSGHCIDGALSFTIHLGSNNLEGNDSNRLTLSTSEYLVHPDFNPNTLGADVGLIKLRIPIGYTDYVRQIRFMPTYRLQNGAPVIAIGWGQLSDSDSGLSELLQSVNLTTISTSECQLFYGNQVDDDMVCVNGNYNEGSCIGDMGAPLIQYVGMSYYLNVGVASFISGNGCESIEPSGYTRTFSYIDWIKSVTNVTDSYSIQ